MCHSFPSNREFDLEMLEADESREFGLDTMIDEAKSVVEFNTEVWRNVPEIISSSRHGGMGTMIS